MRKAFLILPFLLVSILLADCLISETYGSDINVNDQNRIDLNNPSVAQNLKNIQNRTYPVTVYSASSPTKKKVCKIAVHITAPEKKLKVGQPFTFYVTFTNTGEYPIDSNLNPLFTVLVQYGNIKLTNFEVTNGTFNSIESPWIPSTSKWYIGTIQPGQSKTMKVTGTPTTKGMDTIMLIFIYQINNFYDLKISEVTFNTYNKQYKRNNTRSTINLNLEAGTEITPLILAFLSCGIGFIIAKRDRLK